MTVPNSLTLSDGTSIRVISTRLYLYWRGVWVSELQLDPPTTLVPPTSGSATLVIGAGNYPCTIDPRGSGSFLTKSTARVVGGAGGWDKTVPAKDFNSDLGVPVSTIWQDTANQIGETLNVLSSANLGVNVPRSSGPASRVLDGADWWVGLDGVTNIGDRPQNTADASLTIIDYFPDRQLVSFSSDVPLLPNTPLTDPRFNGVTLTVRDVEQVFDRDGSRGWAWCSSSSISRGAAALATFVKQTVSFQYLCPVRYKFNSQSGARGAFVPSDPSSNLPPISPLIEWMGVPGASAKLRAGQEVLVGFDFTKNPPTPVILSYDPSALPTSTTFDAIQEIDLGPSSVMVKAAGGQDFVILATPYNALLSALQTFAGALNTSTTLANVIAAGTALQSALGLLPAPASTKFKAT